MVDCDLSSCIFPLQLSQMSSHRPIQEARAWYFKVPRVACPSPMVQKLTVQPFHLYFGRLQVSPNELHQSGQYHFFLGIARVGNSIGPEPCSCGRFHALGR